MVPKACLLTFPMSIMHVDVHQGRQVSLHDRIILYDALLVNYICVSNKNMNAQMAVWNSQCVIQFS